MLRKRIKTVCKVFFFSMLSAAVFSGCEKEQQPEEIVKQDQRPLATQEVEEQIQQEPEYTLETIDWEGPEGYVIVYAKGDRTLKAAAESLSRYFEEKAGVNLQVTDDSTKSSGKEILIGDTNRRTSTLETNQYGITVEKDTVAFEGGHTAMVETAVAWFTSLDYAKGKLNKVSGQNEAFTAEAKEGYQYVWGDEFAGNTLNTDKWCLKSTMDGTSMMPLVTDEDVLKMDEGQLKLSAIRYYNPKYPAAEYATAPAVCTQDTMSFKYGYVEMRARVPFKMGAWPSLWMKSGNALNNNTNYTYNIEIDIFENFATDDTLTPNIHKWYKDGSHAQYNGHRYDKEVSNEWVFENSNTISEEYHVYGCEWTPTSITMSVDGTEYMTYDLTDDYDKSATRNSGMSGFDVPVQLLMNNHMFAPDYGDTDDSNRVSNTKLPFLYYIDYIRLYQKSGLGELNFAD